MVPFGSCPYVQQWNLTVAQQIASRTVIEVGYAGSKGTLAHVFRQFEPAFSVVLQPGGISPDLPPQSVLWQTRWISGTRNYSRLAYHPVPCNARAWDKRTEAGCALGTPCQLR